MESVCPHCQLQIPKGKFICPICGIDIRDWNPDKLRCPICRSLYPPGTKFCLKDGSPLEKAIVDFDTEATIFLPGGIKSQKPKKDDIIPKLKFSDDHNRAFPKLDRDKKGHLKAPPPPPKPKQPTKQPPPPPSLSFNHPPGPELEMPEIMIDPSTLPQAPDPKKPAKQPPQEPSKPPEADPFLDARAKRESHVKGPYLKVKPLEEYERLLEEEEERMAEQRAVQSSFQKLRMNMAQQKRPGFFKRFFKAVKVLFGK